MLNADTLLALPLLLILQVDISNLKLKTSSCSLTHVRFRHLLQNLSDIDSGLTPYALLNQSGAIPIIVLALFQ